MYPGIDDINLYVTPIMLLTEEMKINRGLSDKAIFEVGFDARSIVPCYEDVVTQAVNAAMPLVKGHEQEYKLLIVATESGIDFGKPISTYVHRYLKLPTACSNFEIKHACYSGTAALKMACAWVHQQQDDVKALVIMSDIGRAHFNDPSEITPGSGAIAVSVSKNPRILEINPLTGCAAKEVYDVSRPTPIYEHGDPILSLSSFLDLSELAWNDFNQKHNIRNIQEHFDYMLFHTPLMGLVKKVHAAIMDQAGDFDAKTIEQDFIARVEPTLKLNAQTGNLFSASIYISLLGLILGLKNDPQRPISLFSYGSGACSEFFEAHIVPNAKKVIESRNIESMLKNRFPLKMHEYEVLIKEQEKINLASDYRPDYKQLDSVYQDYYANKNLLVLESIANYHRKYRFT